MSEAHPSDQVVVEASAVAESECPVAALAAMFAVLAGDQRTVVDVAGAGLTFLADRRGKLAWAARPPNTEPVSVVPGKEVEEESRARSLEAVPAEAPVEELEEVEARYRI